MIRENDICLSSAIDKQAKEKRKRNIFYFINSLTKLVKRFILSTLIAIIMSDDDYLSRSYETSKIHLIR